MNSTRPSAEDQQRLVGLATLVGASADRVLPYVLRDGFAQAERVAKAVLRARHGADATVTHADAMKRLDAMLRHAAAEAA